MQKPIEITLVVGVAILIAWLMIGDSPADKLEITDGA